MLIKYCSAPPEYVRITRIWPNYPILSHTHTQTSATYIYIYKYNKKHVDNFWGWRKKNFLKICDFLRSLSYTALNHTCHRRARVQIVIIIQRPTTIYYTEHGGPFVRMCDRRYILRFSVSGPQRTTFFLKINIAFFHSVLLSHSSPAQLYVHAIAPGSFFLSAIVVSATAVCPLSANIIISYKPTHTRGLYILYVRVPEISLIIYICYIYYILILLLYNIIQCLTRKIKSKHISGIQLMSDDCLFA